jgi:hypothetical protein
VTLKTGRVTLETDRVTLETDRVTLETDRATLQTDFATLETDRVTLQTDHATLKIDPATLKTDRATLQTDRATLKIDFATLQTDHAPRFEGSMAPGPCRPIPQVPRSTLGVTGGTVVPGDREVHALPPKATLRICPVGRSPPSLKATRLVSRTFARRFRNYP